MDKRCSKCKEIKPIDSFSFNKNKKDGHDDRCKKCAIEYAKQYYRNNRGKVLEKEKIFREKHPEHASKQDWKYRHSLKGIITRIKSINKYNKKYPEKYKAHNAISSAIQHNNFPKANIYMCSICGNKKAQEYHHHKGYDKEYWLDVIPVCKICHTKLDSNVHKNGG